MRKGERGTGNGERGMEEGSGAERQKDRHLDGCLTAQNGNPSSDTLSSGIMALLNNRTPVVQGLCPCGGLDRPVSRHRFRASVSRRHGGQRRYV